MAAARACVSLLVSSSGALQHLGRRAAGRRHSEAPPDWIFTRAIFQGTSGDRAEIAGLEFLSGIPGTIGGGFRTNAGAYGR